MKDIEKKKERRKNDYITPDFLQFDGLTDDDGRLYVNFLYKSCHFSTDYEVAVDTLCLDSSTFLNVLESDREKGDEHFTYVEVTPIFYLLSTII